MPQPAAAGLGLLLSLTSLTTGGQATDADFARILKLEDQRSDGGGELRAFLEPRRPVAVRIRAALAAGRIGAPVTTPYDLVAASRDRSVELRRAAVFALGEMDDPRASPLLAASLHDDDAGVRALAAEALGKLKDPASAPSLAALLDDREHSVTAQALLALWKIDTGSLLAVLGARAGRLLSSDDPALRTSAAYFLMRSQMGHPDEPSIEEGLHAASRDGDPIIRSYAARGLGARNSARATGRLLELAADADWRVRVNAFNGLRTRPVATGHAVYETALQADHAGADSGVALSALAALESLAGAPAREKLLGALRHPHPRFREVAAAALAARDKEQAIEPIAPLAADTIWSVRARTAEALGTTRAPAALPLLTRLAADADPRVRSVAVEALGRLGAAAEPAVRAALEDADPFVRTAALEAVGNAAVSPSPADAAGRPTVGDVPAALDRLAAGFRRALADPHNDARLAALAAMAKLGSDAAREEIERALEDPDYLVRRRAAEILRDTFRLDRFSRVGAPPASRTDAEYLEAVRRSRRRVTAVLDTEAGAIEIEMFPADAPLTVDNFIRLARAGTLDGLVVHRVVPNFVIQDGDPRGDGNGGPPWQIRCEINMRRYGEGAVGMALSGKDTGGSQYFVTHSPQPHLDGGYTVFGQVIRGDPVVRRMLQGTRIRKVIVTESPDS